MTDALTAENLKAAILEMWDKANESDEPLKAGLGEAAMALQAWGRETDAMLKKNLLYPQKRRERAACVTRAS